MSELTIPVEDGKQPIEGAVTMADYYSVMGKLAAWKTISEYRSPHVPGAALELGHHLSRIKGEVRASPILTLLADASPGLFESYCSEIEGLISPRGGK